MKIDFRSLANSGLQSLVPYQPGKQIEEVERELGISSSIKLASNENPLGPSLLALAAVQNALQNAHIYPDGNCFELKTALANFHRVNTNQITVGNGSENILELVVKSYLHKGDHAVISQYAFLTIPILIQSYASDVSVVTAKTWGHDIASMLAAINEKTRVLFLVNPNNPTGTYTNDKDFHYLMESIPPHIVVVADEAYAEYITTTDFPNTLVYLHHYPNLIVTRTFSKAYGLAALRLGYGISSPEIADMLNRARLPFNVNTLAVKAGFSALNDQEHVKKSVILNQQGMQQIEEELHRLRIKFIPSLGNFITMDVTDAADVYQKLLMQGVIVRPLTSYGMPRHIRVTIGTVAQNERFIKALHLAMSSR